MEHLLAFFSDLITFTFGLAVLIFWLLIFGAIAIEVHDLIFGDPTEDEEED